MNAGKELSISSGLARSKVEEISHLASVIAAFSKHESTDVVPGIGLIGDHICCLALEALEAEKTAEAAIEKEKIERERGRAIATAVIKAEKAAQAAS